MNKIILIALAVIGACALAAQAGRPQDDKEVLEGAKKAFSNINFFSDLIAKNGMQVPTGVESNSVFKRNRNHFQESINKNGGPIPHPQNPEVDVYLHDGVDEDESEEQKE